MAFHALIASLTDNRYVGAASDAGLRCDTFEFSRRHDLEGAAGSPVTDARRSPADIAFNKAGVPEDTPGERSDCVPATGAVCERVQAHRKTWPPPTPRVTLEEGAVSAGVFCYAAGGAGDRA